MNERMRFVARLQEGAKMVDLCHEYAITRKTGHKIWSRFKAEGLCGLEDKRRVPKHIPHRTSPELRALILKSKKQHPTWGPKKLRAWLERKETGLLLPSANTFGYWLKRAGLVKERRARRRRPGHGRSELTNASAANEVWCTDFKGQFRLGNGQHCFPLTITDLHSRFLIACTALEGTAAVPALWAFTEAFREYGLPRVIRTDNGCPFASSGMSGLTILSARWLRLGIRHERIEPAHPEQNGQHERMHLTLKRETTRPAGANLLQQQERFDTFRREFNEERPHEALGQSTPASHYKRSERTHPEELPDLVYPLHDLTRVVNASGVVSLFDVRIYVSHALAGEAVGLRELKDRRWLVSYGD